MKRREFLGMTVAGMGSFLPACGGGGGGGSMMGGPAQAPRAALAAGQPLRTLPTLANTATQAGHFAGALEAAPASLALVDGATTALWLYNGLLPGPLVEVREGDRVRIALGNRLAIDSTVHWHGLPVPADQDGNPMDPVAPGASRVYEFDIPSGTAGTYWYHPHAHGTTAEQVSRGLAAPFIVRAASDPLAGIPEVTMLVTGIRLDGSGQVSPNGPMDFTVGRQGEQLLVNGGRLPVHTVRPGETQRWRILNATSAHYLRLALDGHAFTLVGTDGGLLGAPVGPLGEILVAPAQRVEVVVTASATPGARFVLRALRHATDSMGMGVYATEELLTLSTTTDPAVAAFPLPATLRPVAEPGTGAARKRLALTQSGMGMMGGMFGFLINGRAFDMNRVDLVSTAGETESWDIVNDTLMDHPIHIHGTQFQLVSRESAGRVTAAPYRAWIDTVDVPAGTTATIRVRQDLPGKRMVHCHILEHEDAGMMAVLEVRRA
ncbi:MAG: multicopper oxidase family protein [Betaproteobacteria bacterium]|nr:multicopper oxidase family protein [Betaproteobacteria bacterium]